jgi:hypothetical protein
MYRKIALLIFFFLTVIAVAKKTKNAGGLPNDKAEVKVEPET